MYNPYSPDNPDPDPGHAPETETEGFGAWRLIVLLPVVVGIMWVIALLLG